MNPFRVAWHVAHHRGRLFWAAWVFWTLFFTFPAATGWTLARAFGALEAGDTNRVYWWALATIGMEAGRMAVVHAGVATYHRAWVHQQAFLQANLLSAQLASGGPNAGRPVASAGEAVTVFRDDVQDVATFVDNLIDVSGGLVFFSVAMAVLGYTNAAAADRAGGGRPRISTCFLVDDYFTRFSRPAELVPLLLAEAGRRTSKNRFDV